MNTLITVQPSAALIFSPENRTATLQIVSLVTERVSFRIKTNLPHLYNVSPSQGFVEAKQTCAITIKYKEVGEEEDPKNRKHKFQVLASADDGREQTLTLVASFEREESVSHFVTSVLQDEPVEDAEKVRASMKELNEQSLKMTKEIDMMKTEIMKIEHQLRFRGESKLQTMDTSGGYTVLHLVVGFIVGLLLAAIIR